MSPKARIPLGSRSASKSIGKVLTFYSRSGRQCVKHYSAPTGAPSAGQLAQRLIVKDKVAYWQAFSDADKLVWNTQAAALGDPWSGYTLFMSTFTIPPPVPPAAGTTSILDFRMSGRYFTTGVIGGPIGGGGLTINQLWAAPFYCGPARSFDRIAFRRTTTSGAALTRLGVYLDNDSIYPAALVTQSDELSTSGAGHFETAITWTSTAYKLYWLAILSNAAIFVRAVNEGYHHSSIFGMDLASMGTTFWGSLAVAQAYGALPDNFPAGAAPIWKAVVPAIFLRTV